jgi:hypothetical protein
MKCIRGTVVSGLRHFQRRITQFPEVFKRATGEDLFKGTLNVRVAKQIKIREHFKIRGSEINEPEQDLLFEICRINKRWAYRIRPCNVTTGSGGHGDETLEIACSEPIPNASQGSEVEVELFRDDIDL